MFLYYLRHSIAYSNNIALFNQVLLWLYEGGFGLCSAIRDSTEHNIPAINPNLSILCLQNFHVDIVAMFSRFNLFDSDD